MCLVKKASWVILTMLAPALASFAQMQTTVNWSNTSDGALKNSDNATLLLAGTSVDGDGFVLELGYYDQATIGNNFTGTWVPLTGQNSANEVYGNTSIGDTGGGPDGRFSLVTTFVQGSTSQGEDLPSATTIPLTIRFYNATSTDTATAYGAVSNDAWLWKIPSTLPGETINISISGSTTGLEWLGGGSGYYTNTAIPEPSVEAILMIGVLIVAFCRRIDRRGNSQNTYVSASAFLKCGLEAFPVVRMLDWPERAPESDPFVRLRPGKSDRDFACA
jgi:hypothetical protein